jgi:hypothetical protein
VDIEIKDPEAIPRRIIGEKKRFLYLASKLLQNSILRGNVRTKLTGPLLGINLQPYSV